MPKFFNVNGVCRPDKHYMVDLSSRLEEVRAMVDAGQYFTINRARQYGKTTMLRALGNYLRDEFEVVSLDFQRLGALAFENEASFVEAFSEELLDYVCQLPDETHRKLTMFSEKTAKTNSLQALFKILSKWCEKSNKPIVLIIDEIDTATNNQVFIDFLAQLRAAYIDSDIRPTFQSVILAGVYDVRNIRRKIRPDEDRKVNSPWNIAADFLVDMNFSVRDIAGMLREYEADCRTGMDIDEISELIYNYTSGYPYLVSRICKYMDERIMDGVNFLSRDSVWTKNGIIEAVKMLVNENNTLFQSLTGKLIDYPELKKVIYELLFNGKQIPYVSQNQYIETVSMFGFIKNENGTAVISNRIFEMVLYNLFISEEFTTSKMYDAGIRGKNQFITDDRLNVRRVLEKFVETFDYLYGDRDETFLEDAGRRDFMLFLKPIINGVGNCYVEAETRNRERMDLVIDYRGEQHICELKIWHGNAYNQRGEQQLLDYLDYFHLTKGYMLSFNFNKRKEIGVKEIVLGNKTLIEAVV